VVDVNVQIGRIGGGVDMLSCPDFSPGELASKTHACGNNWQGLASEVRVDRSFFVLIILYSLYLEYDSPLLPSASGLAS
jgi:hypothetical protein